MREIVKREAIEISIAGASSAVRINVQCILVQASRHQFGWAEKGWRKVTSLFGVAFYRRQLACPARLRKAAAFTSGQAWL